MDTTIKLKGLSKRGKERIKSHGDTFNFQRDRFIDNTRFILVNSLNPTWRGEKWLGWFEVGKEVEIIE